MTRIRQGYDDMAWRSPRQRNTTGQRVTGIEARGGFLDRPVLTVLAVSLVLIAMVFGALLLAV
jgi:hypothetical protein